MRETINPLLLKSIEVLEAENSALKAEVEKLRAENALMKDALREVREFLAKCPPGECSCRTDGAKCWHHELQMKVVKMIIGTYETPTPSAETGGNRCIHDVHGSDCFKCHPSPRGEKGKHEAD